MSRLNIADEEECSEVGDNGIELGEHYPSRGSFVRRTSLGVSWRRAEAGYHMA